MPQPIVIRRIQEPASPELIHQLVHLIRVARRGPLQFLIDLHDADEDARFFESRLLPENEVWVAELEDRPVGLIAFHDGWVKWLFVDPAFQRRGIGSRLLAIAKESSPSLQLWVFEANHPTIDLYLRQGFTVAERTDGADNVARLPDLRMVWEAMS